jgi:predicted regulator of Ras-like GTPase activity (Roadblock/LC7/MglB family)/lipopolysaccharide biosynthesis regulator YciM
MANDAMAEVEELKKKLSQNPDSLIFVPLADAYRKAGQLDEAIEVCKKGLEKHPSYMSARVVLGRIYGEKDMLDEAVTELQKVEKADVDNIMVHIMLGNVYLKKKIYAEAVSQFQRVLALNPDDSETQEKLEEALSAKQGPAEAKAEAVKPQAEAKPEPAKVEAAVEAKPEAVKPTDAKQDVSKSMKAAELYTKKGEFDKSIEIYKEILDGDPGNIIISQRLREVYDFQDKKMIKAKAKTAEPSNKIDLDKFTTEDILGLMKEAVENESVDEKIAQPPANPEAAKKETAEKVEEKVTDEVKAEPEIPEEKRKKLEKVLVNLNEAEGMVGSFFLLRDGSIVASVLPKNINAAETGKIIASIVEKTEASVKNMNQGKLHQVIISSETGLLLFSEVLNGVLFMIGNEAINVGKIRLILRDVTEHIKEALA